MSLQFVDTANHHSLGDGADSGMAGIWAGTGGTACDVVEPSFGAYSGTQCWRLREDSSLEGQRPRFAFKDSNLTEVFFSVPVYFANLPHNENSTIRFRNAGNTDVCWLQFNPTGTISLVDGGGVMATTTAPVITAASWTWFETRLVVGSGTAIWQLRDQSGNVLANESSLTIADTFSIVAFRSASSAPTDPEDFYFGEPIVKSTSGAAQNTWYAAGGVKAYLLRAKSDNPASEWSFTGRRMYGPGVGQNTEDSGNNGWRTADAAALELGSGDYTIEGTFRWNELPGSGESQYLASKWLTSSNLSWGLRLYESGGSYYLEFAITTGGTTGTEVVIHDFPFEPTVYTPYQIAISRDSSVNRLFIDGIRKGPATADANTYANTTASVVIGARLSASTTMTESFNGWVDEFRYTVGVGRYTAEYTPDTAAFPRDNTDPDWNSVQWLMGWDTASIDESQYGRTVFTNGGATQFTTDDGLFAYQSIDKNNRDDTFIEAAFIASQGTLEFISNPLAGEEVVIGTETYTFVAALSVAFDILIGADADESIDNLLAAINGDAGEGTTYGTGTTPNADADATPQPGSIILVQALVPGVAGDSIVFTTDVTDAVISGSGTLEGGEDIPGPGTYVLDRLPRGVTRIEAVALYTKRSVYGPGAAEIQPSFIDGSAAASTGAETSAPANPAWQVDLFSDNGGNSWAPSQFIGAQIQVNRTS